MCVLYNYIVHVHLFFKVIIMQATDLVLTLGFNAAMQLHNKLCDAGYINSACALAAALEQLYPEQFAN